MRSMVRVIVSLLAMPEENDDEEHALLSRFVVPGMMSDQPSAGATG